MLDQSFDFYKSCNVFVCFSPSQNTFQCIHLAKGVISDFYIALKFGSEAWVLRKREEQRLEAAQMKFLGHLLGITKLDKEKNQSNRQKTEAQNTVKEIKQYQKK